MQDYLNIIMNATQPPNKKIKKCNLKQINNEFYAVLKNSTLTSGNLTNNNQTNIGTIKETKTKSNIIGCDIIVN